MANKYGPTRADLTFRLWFSVAGLALLVFVLVYRGIPTTPGGWEAVLIGALFFGGSFAWVLRKLLRKDYSDAE